MIHEYKTKNKRKNQRTQIERKTKTNKNITQQP